LGFGFSHGYQSPAGIVRATLLGAVLGVPVIATGALGPSIIAHTGVDLLSGLYTLRLFSRWGLLAHEAEGHES